jgi:hypothetical protein
MNERIRQLAEQAGAETWSRAPMRAVTGLAFTDENLEKFAELIVRECAEIALREDHDPYECILKHFGIDSVSTSLRNRSTYYGNDV